MLCNQQQMENNCENRAVHVSEEAGVIRKITQQVDENWQREKRC